MITTKTTIWSFVAVAAVAFAAIAALTRRR